MKRKLVRFDEWLKQQLKDRSFRKAYEEEDIRARLALRIGELRRKKGMTQGQLARKLHASQQVVSSLETLRTNVTLRTLERVAAALDSRLVLDLR
ncbi:MAG: helix-turn-helix transcriptional regulator [Candidatus Coatesbacteria bacterium]